MKEKVFRRAGKRVLNVSEKAGVFTLIKFLIRKPDKRRGVFSFLQMFACFNVELFKCFPVPSFFRVPCPIFFLRRGKIRIFTLIELFMRESCKNGISFRQQGVVEVAFRLQSAAGHQCVSDADGGGCLELHSDVILIIFLQKGTVNDIEEVLLMLRPVFLSQFSGYLSELSGKVITGNIIGALQHGLHRIQMALLQLPQPGSAGMFTGSGVGNIKNIAPVSYTHLDVYKRQS